MTATVSSTQQQLLQIAQILREHRGKGQAVNSGVLARLIGLHEHPCDAHIRIRALIFASAQTYCLPIGACSEGYYTIINEKELLDYVSRLKSRSSEILERAKIIYGNFYQSGKQATLSEVSQ